MPETITPGTVQSSAVPSRTIAVPFEGEGSGTGELTWGQRELLRAIRFSGRSIPIGGVTPPLPQPFAVDDIVASVQFIMRRHQSLRTRFVPDAQGRLRQVLSSHGELVIELYDAAPDEDPRQLAQTVSDRYSQLGFELEHDWPLRAAAVSQHGAVRYAVFIYNHLAVDGMGMLALLDDLLYRDPATGEPRPLTALQPLELAERQSSAAARRQCELALRHWESVARAVPDRESAAAEQQDPPYRELWFRSPAALPALRAVAARCGTDTGPVLLAASAIAISRVTELSPVALLSIVNNRFRPGLADAVMQLAQRSPCLLDVEGQTFEQVVAQAQRASLRAGMSGYFDPDECDRMLDRVAQERGKPVDLSCYYNDRRSPEPAESTPVASGEELSALINSLLPQTSQRWGGQSPSQDNKLFLHINDSPDAVDILISADASFLGSTGLERCARELEAVLVRAATETAAPPAVTAPAEGAAEPAEPSASIPGSSR